MTIINKGIQAMLDPLSVIDEENKKETNHKEKAIRKSFSLTAVDIDIIDSIKNLLDKRMINITDSEVIKVALGFLKSAEIDQVLQVYKTIQRLPAGRPKKDE